jgi:tetracycline 7-halogenase / FADH2 O2-dependent halogenase
VASQRIFERLGALDFLPGYMGFGKPGQRAPSSFTLPMGARHVLWYRRHPEAKWRDHCGFSLLTYAFETFKFMLALAGDSTRRMGGAWRDVFFANNGEWRHQPHALRAHPLRPLPTQAPVARDEQFAPTAESVT